MRLRLVVQRNALPDTPIVWDIDTQQSAPIISTLLEEINDVIPIESSEWGLEDYAVEIKGKDGVNFELLHFQPVGKVLHEDDEVIIRPLLTQDLRVRRVSGRHQISTDGRHLVDGIAFGRPLLRKPVGRPPINIPPRKKRRITYDEDEDGNEIPLDLEEEAGNSDRQIVLHEGFDDDDDDSEEDEDFEPGEESDEDAEEDADEDMEDVSRQLVVHADFLDEDEEDDGDYKPGDDGEQDERFEQDLDEDVDIEGGEEAPADAAASNGEDPLYDVPDAAARISILALFEAFPKATLTLCKLIFQGTDGDMNQAYTALEKGFLPSKSRSAVVGSSLSAGPSTPALSARLKAKKLSGKNNTTEDHPAGPAGSSPATRSKKVPVGLENCLAGLSFYFTGNLPTMSRDMSQELVKRYGGKVSRTPSSNISYVVLGSDAESRDLRKIQELDINPINEEGLFKLIRSFPANGGGYTKNSIAKIAKELENYDQSGLPEGSIKSSTTPLHTVDIAAKSSPLRSHRRASRSASLTSNKSVRFAIDQSPSKNSSKSLVAAKSKEEEASEESSSDEATSETSSNESSDSDSSSEEDSDKAEATDEATSSSDSDSDSDDSSSSSDSDSDSGPDEISSRPITTSTKSSGPKGTSAGNTVKPVQETVPPGQGKKATQSRNQRRRNGNILNRFKEKGILPSGTTIAEFLQLKEVDSQTTPEDALAALEAVRATREADKIPEKSSKAIDKDAEFEARRRELLASLASGGIEVGYLPSPKARNSPLIHASDNSNGAVADAISSPAALSEVVAPKATEMDIDIVEDLSAVSVKATFQSNAKSSEVQVARSSSAIKSAIPETSSPKPTPVLASAESTQNSSAPRRRAKLDVGAGRRMLFGALGIKTPKTKSDEDKVRSDLMKYVRPEKAKEPTPEPASEANENEDPVAWKEKINYRAVECCHEGIELSEPPFPFVQRWDPQQQGSWSQKGKRGGKRKKSQRDQSQYYNEEEGSASKRQKRKDRRTYAETQEFVDASYDPTPFEQLEDSLDASYVPSHQEDSMILESMDTRYDDQSQQTKLRSDDIDSQIGEKLMKDVSGLPADDPFSLASQGVDEDDLPALPDNIASLPDLKVEEPTIGMVIAFKQLVMSEATRWQPQLSNYCTAVVIKVPEEGGLELTLAKRDRIQSKKQYDEETGERIYGKFDMPDDEDEEDDDGYLNLTFSELVEPKLVQAAPPSLSAKANAGEKSPSKARGSTDDSTTLNHEHTSDHQDHQERQDHQEHEGYQHESMVPETQVNATGDGPESLPVVEIEQPDIQEPFVNIAAEAAPLATPLNDKESEPDLLDQLVNVDVASPASNYEDAHTIAEGVLPEPPSEGTRQKITDMIKEAGFRSNVPSSVLRDIRSRGKESPGDAAVFEKLMKDMSEIEKSSSYSPKFNGFSSSPPADVETEASSPIRGPRRREPATNPVPHTSYTTANEEPSSGPFGPITSLDGVDERASSTSVHYPKLSVASSLASQASDHGRQPDFEVPDDDAMMQMDDSEYSVLKNYDEAASVDTESELLLGKAVNEPVETSPSGSPAPALSSDDDFPSLEEVFASQRQIKGETQTPRLSQGPTKISKEYEAAVAALSDEDSGQSTPKASQNPIRNAKKVPNLGIAQASWEALQPQKDTLVGALRDAKPGRKSAFSQSQPTPRARSQSQIQAPPKATQPKTRVASSQPVVKQSQDQKMVIPEGSEVWDLTLSSEAEPGSEAGDKKSNEPESEDDSEDAYFKKFKKCDSDDDDDFVLDESMPKRLGWGEKKTGVGRTTRRTSEAAASQSMRGPRRKTTSGR